MKFKIEVLLVRLFVFLLSSLLVMYIWNGVLVGIFSGIKEVSWFQTVCIMVMCNILFKPTKIK